MSNPEQMESFLNEANIAVLATVDAKSRAHAAPIWYLYEDGEFLMATDRGSQKHRNIEAHPDVTLVIDRRTLPYFAAMVRGRARIGPAFTDEQRLTMAVRYAGEEMGRAYIATTQGEDSVSIRLCPDKIIEFNGRAGRD